MADRMIFVRTGRLVVVRMVDLDNREDGARKPQHSHVALHRGSFASRSYKAMMASTQRERQARLEAMEKRLRKSSDSGSVKPPTTAENKEAAGGESLHSTSGSLSAWLAITQPMSARGSRTSELFKEPPPRTGDTSAPSTSSSQHRRKRLLRVGTVGPYQYYGDRQLCHGEVYPVSLVSDPVAEIYIMSKQDILRRLPKKIFSGLFTEARQDILPTDDQLLQMNRQTERWVAFRRGMHAEALDHRPQVQSLRPREPTAARRLCAAENLEFLGVNTSGALAKRVLPLPSPQTSSLTDREQEHFSDASADFLRKVKNIRTDAGLRKALERSGMVPRSRVGDLLADQDPKEQQRDPLMFWFEEYWSRLVTDPVSLDIDAALNAEEAPKPGSSGGRLGESSVLQDPEGTGNPQPDATLRLPSVRRSSALQSSKAA
mmetsp:Transcript_87569/g.261199  ORF Transcript_87569/g.261199 Transcript_87569/m.261199 type:complete len:431 (+) Transcript_87569:3-1295(+)